MSLDVRTFGKYLLDEEIARGGMSRVYLARLRGLGGFEKRLVVKQVLPELAKDPRFVSMFVNEAKTVVQMSHPNIAPVFELGVVDGVYFLAMEYVEGATLSEILRDGPLAPELAAHVGAETCDALHYAHSRFDVVHRDVTPRNVIVDDAGHSRLLDFGIAAPAHDEGGSELFGTPGYLSPEQLAGEPLGPASDVFSLGAVLYEALTGERAFPGNTVDEARVALDGDGPSTEALPAVLRGIVGKALHRDRAERYADARSFGRALRGWLAGHAPEGVGPELGQRAASATRDRERPPEEAPVATPGGGRGEVKTLATSRLLDEMVGIDAPATAAIEGRRSRPERDEPSTAAIRGRRGRDSEPEEAEPTAAAVGERGAPRKRRRSKKGLGEREGAREVAAALPSDEETWDQDEPEPVPRAEPRGAGVPRWLVAAGAGLAVALAAWIAWPTPSDEPRVGVDEIDAPPPDVEPAVDGAGQTALTATGPGEASDPPLAGTGAGPEATGPETTGPEATEPEATGPEATGPEATGPETTAPESTGPETTDPEPTDPGDPGRSPPHPPGPAEPTTSPGGAGGRGRNPGAEPSERPGRTLLTVNARPWGEVRVDGRAVGNTPQRSIALRPGPHRIEVHCPPLGRTATTTVEATGGSITVVANLDADPPVITLVN